MKGSLVPPPARQGPGPIPAPLVDALDLGLARKGAGYIPGDRPAAGVGQGTELAQLRPYQVGDDVRQIDPAASARTGAPHVRLHVPERILTSWLVLDVSPSMSFGTAERLKSDVAEGVALVVSRVATRRGGRLAAMTAGGPERLLPPRSGPYAQIAVQRLLAEGVAPDGSETHGLGLALHRAGKLANQPGLVVVISDFRGGGHGAGYDWDKPMRMLATRHIVLAVEIRDPREEELPAAGRLSLVDPESGRIVEVDTSRGQIRERFALAASHERAQVAATLKRARVQHVVLSTQGSWLHALGRALH